MFFLTINKYVSSGTLSFIEGDKTWGKDKFSPILSADTVSAVTENAVEQCVC